MRSEVKSVEEDGSITTTAPWPRWEKTATNLEKASDHDNALKKRTWIET
jgi:hypothetical protein